MERSFKGKVKILKIAGLKSYLLDLSNRLDIDLHMEIDKGWIYETVYFRGTGEADKVEQFEYRFRKDMQEYVES